MALVTDSAPAGAATRRGGARLTTRASAVTLSIVLAIAVGYVSWSAWQRAHARLVRPGAEFRVTIDAHPMMRAGLNAVLVDVDAPSNASGELQFSLRPASLGSTIGSYEWDWKASPFLGGDLTVVDLSRRVGQDGGIAAWDIDVARPGIVRLKVWRDLGDRWVAAEQSAPVAAVRGLNHFVLPEPLPVRAGDYVGLYSAEGGLKLSAPLSLGSSVPLTDQDPANLRESVYRGLQYEFSGDVSCAPKVRARPGLHPGYSFKVIFSDRPMIAAAAVGDVAGVRTGGGGAAAFSIIDLAARAPSDGVLTAWEAVAVAPTTLQLKLWRKDGVRWIPSGESKPIAAVAGLNQFPLVPPLRVHAGDLLGYYSSAGELPNVADACGGANPGKLYALNQDLSAPIADSALARDTYGRYAFRAVYDATPVPPAATAAVWPVRAGRSTLRFDLPAHAYARDESVELAIRASSGASVALLPQARRVLRSGRRAAAFVSPEYGDEGSAGPAIVPSAAPTRWTAVVLVVTAAVGVFAILGRGRSAVRLLLAALPVVATALIWRDVLSAGDAVNLAVGVLAMMWLPGYVLLEAAFPQFADACDAYERMPLLFALSLALWTAVAPIAFRIQPSRAMLIAAVLAFNLLGLAWLLVRRRPSAGDAVAVRRPLHRVYNGAMLAALAVFALVIAFTSQFQRTDIDTYMHLAGYRKIADSGTVVGGNALLGPAYPGIVHYASNPWYLAYGMTAHASRADVTVLYVLFAGVLSAVALLTVYSLVRFLAGDPRVAAIATLLLLVFDATTTMWTWHQGGLYGFYEDWLPYPFTVAELILCPVALLALFRYARAPGRAAAALCALVALAAIGQHPVFALWFTWVMAAAAGVIAILPFGRAHRVRTVTLAAVVAASGLLIMYLMVSFPLVGTYRPPSLANTFANWAKAYGWWVPANGWYMMGLSMLKPLAIGLAALAVSGLLLHWIVPDEDGAGRTRVWIAAAAALIAVPAVVFNPLLMTLVLRLTNSYEVLNRSGDPTGVLVRVAVSTVMALILCVPLRIRTPRLGPVLAVVPLLVCLGIGAARLAAAPYPAGVVDALANRGWYPSLLDEPHDPLYLALGKLQPAVAAVPQERAEMLAALSPHHVIAVRDFWMGDFRNIKERQRDNRDIVSFAVTPAAMRDLLRKYGCRYVIVPAGSPQLGRFRDAPALFTEAADTGAHIIFVAQPQE